MKTTRIKEQTTCNMKRENSCTTTSKQCTVCDTGGTKGGWLDLELCAKARREEVDYILRHKMYTRVPRETSLRETCKAPIKPGWVGTQVATRERGGTFVAFVDVRRAYFHAIMKESIR